MQPAWVARTCSATSGSCSHSSACMPRHLPVCYQSLQPHIRGVLLFQRPVRPVGALRLAARKGGGIKEAVVNSAVIADATTLTTTSHPQALHAADAQHEEQEGDAEEELWSEAEHLIVKDGFLPGAQALADHFQSRFADPRSLDGRRFVWDYWHVPGQYTLLRTPAEHFFPPHLYQQLEDALLAYGESRLGCRSCSQVWLSYYVDGCRQELHTDSPHGPWAFVLSLTDWEGRCFTGGETLLLSPHTLDYWRGFGGHGQEMNDLVTLVEPQFNRLTVFDPRLPHGVRLVHGNADPARARIVLHGWFTEPSPFFTGALSEEEAVPALNDMLDGLYPALGQLARAHGTLTVRLHICGATGAVSQLEWLTDTLVIAPGEAGAPGEARSLILATVAEHTSKAVFPTSDQGDTFITFPFEFE